MNTLTIRLPAELRNHLTAEARRAGKTPARFIRETLEKRLRPAILETQGGTSLYELTRDLCGSVGGGPRDLASNKKHLNGYGTWQR
jgi:hypothetical protein